MAGSESRANVWRVARLLVPKIFAMKSASENIESRLCVNRVKMKRSEYNVKTIIHVNQHRIKSNAKNGKDKPVLTVKNYMVNRYGHTAILRYNGAEVGRFIYSPNKPLSCGAKVWFESNNVNVEVVVHDGCPVSDEESPQRLCGQAS